VARISSPKDSQPVGMSVEYQLASAIKSITACRKEDLAFY
jgi:hypothetical protein